MKIIDAKVNWMEEYANMPGLKILVDRIPMLDEFLFERKGSTYYAELDGHVRFFAWSKPGEGFGGRTFNLHMKGGEVKALKGPWSSRAGAVNRVGFGPCLDVSMVDDEASWKRGYTFMASAMTLDKAQEAAKIAGVHLVKTELYGDLTYYPSLDPDKLVAYKKDRKTGKILRHECGEDTIWKLLSPVS